MPVSIRTLPEELLIKVFAPYLDSEGATKMHGRTLLALVCTWWRDIIYHTPVLWAEVHSPSTKVQSSLALSKSASCPLQVSFDITALSASRRRQMQSLFVEVCEHMERWQAATIKVDRQDAI